MNPFQQRLEIGLAHEQHVAEELTLRKWTVDPAGQGALSEPVRVALSNTDSALRWMPDMIAARGEIVVLVDAKDSMSPDSGRFAISRDSVRAHQMLTAWTDTPIYYVLGEQLRVMTPHDVIACGRIGPHVNVGRRGPYYLVAAALARPFDDVFGSHEHVTANWATSQKAA